MSGARVIGIILLPGRNRALISDVFGHQFVSFLSLSSYKIDPGCGISCVLAGTYSQICDYLSVTPVTRQSSIDSRHLAISQSALGYTVAHSAIDCCVEGQLFNTSEQQVPLSRWSFSCLVSMPPKNVSYLGPSAHRHWTDGICPHVSL